MLCVIDILTSVLRNPAISHPQRRVSLRWKPVHRSPVGPLVGLALALAMATPALLAGQSANVDEPRVAFVHVASPEQRLQYLATAQIWADPGELTPDALLAGPPLEDGSGLEAALDGRPFPCTFAKPGKTMGGNTPKFVVYHDHRQDDPVEVHRRVEERQPRSVCGGRGITPAVGAGVQVGPNLPDIDRLPGLPRRSHVGERAEGAAFVPRDLSAAIHRAGDGGSLGTGPGVAMGGARSGDQFTTGR